VMASRCWVADNAFARTQCGRKTTRAIRAVQMSAGDKERSAEFPNLAKRVFSDPGRSRRRISLSETAIQTGWRRTSQSTSRPCARAVQSGGAASSSPACSSGESARHRSLGDGHGSSSERLTMPRLSSPRREPLRSGSARPATRSSTCLPINAWEGRWPLNTRANGPRNAMLVSRLISTAPSASASACARRPARR
jgi:hypothetical protein